ncbi:MAG: hypothetical protein JSR37_01310 [Verrucomicrobia bacterium]|nr:hypothetical protein [Verrucomicrobiota bacterium]MBS0635875.1 hypothetical protein [Verrucomicrobiota bacterium]
MQAIFGFINSIVEPDECVVVDEHKLKGYIACLGKDCSLCTDDFQRSDLLARTIIRTSCCPIYYHEKCLAEYRVTTCPSCYKPLGDHREWKEFVAVADKKMREAIGCNDEKYVQNLVAQEEAAEKAQIEADLALAIRLQNQG